MRGHDEVDGNDDVFGEARPQHVPVPDSWFAAVLEALSELGICEQRKGGKATWVESEIGVGGEWLVAGQAAGGA